ncbi:MAG: hypothetical protein IT308_12045 [Anaerolineaceae bacterium]|nr:hypothetical protein [Anaerolineaceae bacterium]
MSRRSYLLLFISGLVLHLAISLFQVTPGYMDAEYYFAGGRQIADGAGFFENFLWNYLDDPAGIPHPSFTYWMPLPSMLAALGMFLAREENFLAGRFFFLLLAAGVPLITARLAFSLTHKISHAWLAGLLALFGGFYSLYLSNTESFSPVMVLGGVFLLVASDENWRTGWRKNFVLSLLAGLMHLSRADGILWLFAVVGLIFLEYLGGRKKQIISWRDMIIQEFLVLGTYFGVMGAWFLRNIRLYGLIFSPASSKAMWLTDYNDTFFYPASQLTFSRWLTVGWSQHLLDRLDAFWSNLKTVLAVQGEIFLLPLILIGLWHLRKRRSVQVGVLMWFVIFFVMTVLFPYAGARGGLQHSGAAIQPLLWAAAPLGLEKIIYWFGSRRGWDVRQAMRIFSAGAVTLSAGLTVLLIQNNVIGNEPGNPAWSQGYRRYQVVGQYFEDMQVPSSSIFMVNNPPGFTIATGRLAIVVPVGGVDTVLSVAARYNAAYLILEENTTPEMAKYYNSSLEYPGLSPMYYSEDGFRIYRFNDTP